MWKKVKIDGSDYLIRHHATDSVHKVCLTNCIHLWCEHILESDLLFRCKEMNKLVEASDDVFLSHVWSLVDSESFGENDIIRNLAPNATGNELTLQTSLDGFRFKVKFLLALANQDQFYEEVTRPLLTLVCELDKNRQRLVDVINKKDLEIEEYKLEGCQISRKAVQTEPFNLEEFSLNCSESISVSKSLVAACPSQAFTPHVQNMLDKIANAPQIMLKENQDESKTTKCKNLIVTIKSPHKNKRQKIYDDDGESGDDDSNNITQKDVEDDELKVMQEPRPKSFAKTKQNARLKRVLNNL